ncbi:MAG: M15 family metallopeptidase [Flavobacteriales bacterium]|nr:M15 family metallopeptidase [Flavobacteriales bacterium]
MRLCSRRLHFSLVLYSVLVVLCAGGIALAQPPSHTLRFNPEDTVLVNLKDYIPDLLTDVRYATVNNFTKQILYPNDTLRARRVVAVRLAQVQKQARKDGYQIKVFDAYRPLSVQKLMWSIVPDERYVADPAKGSRHNRGCAVDLTLCDSSGVELDMGSDYDEFTERSSVTFLEMPDETLANRRRLASYMHANGFSVLPTEWWHFDVYGWEQFAILDE